MQFCLHPGLFQDWKECQKLCNTIGKTGLFKRVKEFNMERLHPQVVTRAVDIVSSYRLDDVRDTSAGAGAFYAWVSSVLGHYNGLF